MENNVHLKNLIKTCEQRLVDWKSMLEDIHKNKNNFDADSNFIEWYKNNIRDMKNTDQILLKKMMEERRYENEELNPPYFYPWNNLNKENIF